MKIFVLAGKSGSGKDIIGKIFKEEYQKLGEKTCLLKFATPLYEYAKKCDVWNGNIDNKPRDFLQKFGYDIIQQEMKKEYFLADRLIDDIEILSKLVDNFIITDGRMIKEFDRVKSKYPNAKIIHIVRNKYDSNLSLNQLKHITETDLDNYYKYDYTIDNSDIRTLQTQVLDIIESEEKEKRV